jgi:hypothetical protein
MAQEECQDGNEDERRGNGKEGTRDEGEGNEEKEGGTAVGRRNGRREEGTVA